MLWTKDGKSRPDAENMDGKWSPGRPQSGKKTQKSALGTAMSKENSDGTPLPPSRGMDGTVPLRQLLIKSMKIDLKTQWTTLKHNANQHKTESVVK